MENIRNWGAVLSAVSIFCTIFAMLVPSGKMSKTVYMVISMVVLSLAVLPMFSAILNFKSSFKNISLSEETCKSEPTLKDCTESQVQDIVCEKCKEVLKEISEEMEIKFKKTEIFMDKQEKTSIVMIRCKIYVEKEFESFKFKIREKVKDRLGVYPEIIEV